MTGLADAERALAKDDEEGALAALLAAWRKTRAPEIAHLVDAIGGRLEDAIPGPFTGTRAEHHGVWMTICERRRPADWPLLVRSIVLTANRFGTAVVKELLERAKAIGAWDPDPRTTALVIAHLRSPGYESSSSSTYPYWSALCDMLVAHGDPRAAALVESLDYSRILRVYSDRKKASVWFAAKRDETLARLRALPAPAPLGKAELAACAKLAKAIAKRGPLTAEVRAKLAHEPAKPRVKTRPKAVAVTAHDRAAMERHLAKAAAETSRDLVVLDELLAAWRASRSSRIAELIDLVTARLTSQSAELATGSRADMQKAWLATAKRRRAVDLPVLVENLTNTHWRSTDALARLQAIASWPPDPRTGAIVAKLIATPAFRASSTKPFWAALIDFAADHGGAGTLAAFDKLSGTLARRLRQQWTDTAAIATWFENQLAAACERLRAQPPAIEPDEAICQRIASSLGTGTADKLYGEVAANPDDDGLRSVLADVLQQQGDPRGEFIVLQLSGKDPVRADKLLAKHGRAWLGAAADRVHRESARFERGFPVELALTATAKQADALAGDPIWATVRRLYLCDTTQLPETFLRHSIMRVEHLGSLTRKTLTQLLAWPEVPYRSLATVFPHNRADIDALLAARKRLRQLRAYELADQAWLDWLWTSWLADQLEEVTLTSVKAWGNLLGRLRAATTPRIRIRDPLAHLEIEAGPAGSLVAATEMTGKPLAKLLSTIGAGTLTALRAPRPKAKAEARTLESHAQRIGCELR